MGKKVGLRTYQHPGNIVLVSVERVVFLRL
jgi:hypothetical protein